MIKEDLTITIPNHHKKEIGIELLSKILKQAKINKQDWKKVKDILFAMFNLLCDMYKYHSGRHRFLSMIHYSSVPKDSNNI